jgi:hypothetical protein
MYSRTLNENGTLNSRCLYCFMTIGSAVETETELAKIEFEHVCPEKVLALPQKPAATGKHQNR